MKLTLDRLGGCSARALAVHVQLRLLRDESGATALEYVLIASGIALAALTAIRMLGMDVLGLYADVQEAFDYFNQGDGAPGNIPGDDGPSDPPRCEEVGSNCKK